MCNKAVGTCCFAMQLFPDRYKTKEMCDKATVAFLPILNFVPDWFVKSEILGKLDIGVSSNDMNLHDLNSDVGIFFSDDIGYDAIELNNINLDDDSFDEDHPTAYDFVRLMACCNRLKQHRACKREISEVLMPVAWHPTRWWDWSVLSEDVKKEKEPVWGRWKVIQKLVKNW